MSIEGQKAAIHRYLDAIQVGNQSEITKTKYELLCAANNFFELVVNYVALSKNGITYDFGRDRIPVGTKLYRIRRYNSQIDYSDITQWAPPPSHPQNRANAAGEEALYLASMEDVCISEIHLKTGEKYVLAEYEVIEPLEVGGFLDIDRNNELHNVAGIILNAFIIAPSRNELNQELFSYLDNHYGKITLDNLVGVKEMLAAGPFDLPMKFAVLNQKDQYYDVTNPVFHSLAHLTPDGVRYSSCFVPIGTVGITSNAFNIVLYSSGIKKVRFKKYEIKTNSRTYSNTDFLKVLIESGEEHDKT